MSNSESLWVEKYRPRSINEAVLDPQIKKTFFDFIEKKSLPNLILTGNAGCGKTTVARAICTEMGMDYVLINASDDRGIDTVRLKIREYASSMSLTNEKKVVILDEADNMTTDAQKILRGVFEEFHETCRFILTCNFPNKLLPPIHSRCSVIDFTIKKKNMERMSSLFFERVCFILSEEKVQFEPAVVVKMIIRHYPDMRRLLNELQRYGTSGSIDIGILGDESGSIETLVESLSKKQFSKVREWVVQNQNDNQTGVFRQVYDSLYDSLQSASIPEAVIIISEYQYKSAFVADQEINTLACLTELMLKCDFK
jgi:DNA polymerase III delta prime subunit